MGWEAARYAVCAYASASAWVSRLSKLERSKSGSWRSISSRTVSRGCRTRHGPCRDAAGLRATRSKTADLAIIAALEKNPVSVLMHPDWVERGGRPWLRREGSATGAPGPKCHPTTGSFTRRGASCVLFQPSQCGRSGGRQPAASNREREAREGSSPALRSGRGCGKGQPAARIPGGDGIAGQVSCPNRAPSALKGR